MKNINLLVLLGVFLFVGCSDDIEVVNISNENELQDCINLEHVMKFSSFEEYVEMRKVIAEMDVEERIAFENEHGFKSIGRISDEFYDSLDDDRFNSEEGFIAFIEDNSRYLVLREDEDGQIVDPIFYSNNDRYFANADGYFVVDSLVFRVFEKATIYSHINSANELIQVFEDNLSSKVQDSEQIAYYYEELNANNLKSSSFCTGGSLFVRRTHDGRRVSLEVVFGNKYGYFNGTPATFLEYGIVVSSWRRVAGVWKRVDRTMSADVKLLSKCFVNNEGDYRRFHFNGIRTKTVRATYDYLMVIGGHWQTHDIRILAVEGWAINSNLPQPAVLTSCNTDQFPSWPNL